MNIPVYTKYIPNQNWHTWYIRSHSPHGLGATTFGPWVPIVHPCWCTGCLSTLLRKGQKPEQAGTGLQLPPGEWSGWQNAATITLPRIPKPWVVIS